MPEASDRGRWAEFRSIERLASQVGSPYVGGGTGLCVPVTGGTSSGPGTAVGSPSASTAAVNVEYASAQGAAHSSKTVLIKWVDFSQKYGIGYKLSNGCYGVLFNDSSKLLLDKNCFDFEYLKREAKKGGEYVDVRTCYSFADYPSEIKKKITLLIHFKTYIDGTRFGPPASAPFPKSKHSDTFLKKWKRAKKAVLFRLSNKVIQVVFQDLSELILSSGSGTVTFVTSKKDVKTLALSQDLETKEPSLYKRLKYAKDILIQMINGSSGQKKALATDLCNFNNPQKMFAKKKS